MIKPYTKSSKKLGDSCFINIKIVTLQNMNINELLKNNNFLIGRMLSMSKSDYRDANPNSVVCFNANLVTAKDGKIWYGDLDLTKDGEVLKTIAEETNTIIYVLRELDCRFENESEDGIKLINKAVWDTTQEILVR